MALCGTHGEDICNFRDYCVSYYYDYYLVKLLTFAPEVLTVIIIILWIITCDLMLLSCRNGKGDFNFYLPIEQICLGWCSTERITQSTSISFKFRWSSDLNVNAETFVSWQTSDNIIPPPCHHHTGNCFNKFIFPIVRSFNVLFFVLPYQIFFSFKTFTSICWTSIKNFLLIKEEEKSK